MTDATAPETSDAGTVATGRAFDSFDLPEPVREGVRAAGFTHCTPIQEKTLPISLAGKDVAGQAQTGTGKTAAFLITVFTRLLEKPRAGRPAAPRARHRADARAGRADRARRPRARPGDAVHHHRRLRRCRLQEAA